MILADQVADTLCDVLVHHRARCAQLAGHHQQKELWWNAEFALALEGLVWRHDVPWTLGVRTEVSMKNEFIDGRGRTDLAIAPWDPKARNFIEEGDPRNESEPHVWIEVKVRTTGRQGKDAHATKSLLSNPGLSTIATDITKLDEYEWTKNDIVFAVQVLSHDGTRDDVLPPSWAQAMSALKDKHGCFRERVVGFPLGDTTVRWMSITVFAVHLPTIST